MDLDELYQELIVDHARHPRHKGTICNPDAKATMFNPLCGDEIALALRVDDKGCVSEIAFQGEGCSISQASASMMTQLCLGKTVPETRELLKLFQEMLTGEECDKQCEMECNKLGDAVCLKGVKKFAARLRCAGLAWEALGQCLGRADLAASGKGIKSTLRVQQEE